MVTISQSPIDKNSAALSILFNEPKVKLDRAAVKLGVHAHCDSLTVDLRIVF